MKAATFCSFSPCSQVGISIHAAREGGDFKVVNNGTRNAIISIHAAREGGDKRNAHGCGFGGISIHAAREGGDGKASPDQLWWIISIHAAREGGDPADRRG